MNEQLSDMYRFLERAESYPHQPSNVRHIQTHISHVYLVPPFVYKIKKPVDFGFLDYSTLEQRKHFCEREVALNRRLCSGVYLGVTAIAKDGDRYTLDPEAGGDIVDYAVKMKQLDEQYFLQSYIENDRLTREHLERVADKLATFYLQQEPDHAILQYADIEHIRFNTDENFSQTEQFLGDTIEQETYDAIRYFTDRFLEQKEELFEGRIEEGRIVDGHGDLHLEHIHIRPDRICIYDCIEFNDRFRCGDQALDLAFLAMDLDFWDCRTEERYFVHLMREKLDDPELPKLLDFYKCYRAYIKGKVKSLQSAEEEVNRDDRKEARQLASRYFNLALQYALFGSKSVVLIFMGQVASGKSTLANYVSSRLDIESYSSDRIRKSMADLPPDERPPAPARKELYSAERSEQTYRQLYAEALEHMENGQSVTLDATFSSAKRRKKLIEELESVSADFLFIEAVVSDETIRSRLTQRENKEDVVSDARLEDFDKLNDRYEPPEEIDSDHFIRVNTNRSIPETIKSLYELLIDRNLKKD